jgi:hypothetical protein
MDDVFRGYKRDQLLLNGKKFRTFDFTTMYPNLEHERIFTHHVKIAVDEAVAFYDGVGSTDLYREEHPLVLPVARVMELVRFVVDNTYFYNSATLIRQTVGIPMGTNAAPELAHLTLYTSEAQFIDDQVQSGNSSAAPAADERGLRRSSRIADQDRPRYVL